VADELIDYLKNYRVKCLEIMEKVPLENIARVVDVLESACAEGRLIFVCGNGGSAATASHLANDLGKGASLGRHPRFKVLALTDNVPWITALANDLDYSKVFVEQLANFGSRGDVLIGFSGSGNSPNVIEAFRWARENGLVTVGFSGRGGGKLAPLSDYGVTVESDHMGWIEDAHFIIQHLIGYFLMEGGRNKSS